MDRLDEPVGTFYADDCCLIVNVTGGELDTDDTFEGEWPPRRVVYRNATVIVWTKLEAKQTNA